jgi:hypothetical protein
MQIIISNDDISLAESILLQVGEHFDNEQKEVIKCLETKDILACPGSGKTTTLIAKLLILSRQMPFKNNRGICVLTHTNVAINEIKSRSYFASKKLFNYPNHFGTIQNFVDKYLAIPAYILRFNNKRPKYIDNEIFNSIIKRGYNTLHAARTWLDQKREGGLEYLQMLRFNKDNFCIAPKIDKQAFIGTDTSTYREINSLKLQILDWGYLCYEDAYSLAFEYIREHPGIQELISKRFPYVFIDEMQDSSTIQFELLNKIFNNNVIIQKIGDLNQSIFDYDADLECGWTVNNDRTMRITGSKRFPISIASKIENLCVSQQTITGNGKQNEITPVIIVYDDYTIQQVLNKFGEIIIRNRLHQHEKNVFKAVGWRGKPHETKRTIPSYWDGYSKKIKVKKTEFSNLKSYLASQSDSFILSNGVNFYKKRLGGSFLKCLRIAGIIDNGRPFTEKILYKYIAEKNSEFYQNFRVRLANWCLKIHRQEEVYEEIKNYLTNEFKEFFNYRVNNELMNFINSSDLEEDSEGTLQGNNIYNCSSGTTNIEIEVSTIHGVKGETHTATCYLETFFYDYDIKRIINYIKGEYSEPRPKRVKQNLKMAFVGMSRPSHLLCIAVHRDNLLGEEEALQRSGWDVNNELCVNSND